VNAPVPVNLIAYPSGYLYDPCYTWEKPVIFDWFSYVFPTFAAIAALSAATPQQQIQIQNDSDFELRWITYHMDNAAAAFNQGNAPLANITALIVDSGAGRQLMNAAVPLGAIATPETVQPRPLPWPKTFTRNSTITLALTNFDAAATPNIRVTLHGRKIFSLTP
jgi:hypothetical protein